jgi:hypothetical protein
MAARSTASDTRIATRRMLVRSVATLGAALLIDCSSSRDRGPGQVDMDARAPGQGAVPRDSGAAPVTGLPGAEGGDAGAVARDAGAARGTGGEAASAVCPPWRWSAVAGHGWLYARAVTGTGAPLTSTVNLVDIYVRRASDPRPGERADPNDPCAVGSYDQAASKVRILVAAIGFSSQEREFSPQRCLETRPCEVELPLSLDARFYRSTRGGVRLRVASEVPETVRVQYAAAVAQDALARSKALNRPLADELDRAGKATEVRPLDLAIHYTETKLRKRCDARCLDERALDPAVRTYLKGVARRAGRPDPFRFRLPPDRWRREP